MISRADADGIAAGWARHESLRRGARHTATVVELDLAFAVWTTGPAPAEPGDGVITLIDRDTGRLSHWPQVPVTVLAELYRAQRAAVVDPPRTADPEAELRRAARRRVTPDVAAHLTLDGRLFIARGAKGEPAPRHHPLVRAWLDRVPPGQLVRGAARHAEMLVLSDVLHEVDRVRGGHGLAPLTSGEARAMLRGAGWEAFHLRAAGDPLAGRPAEPCESCTELLIDLAVLPAARAAVLAEWRPATGRDPAPGRLPEEVAWVLAEAGWEDRSPAAAASLARVQLARALAVPGVEHRHEAFPAAFEALCRYPPMTTGRKGPGLVQRIRLVEFGTAAAAHSADMLHELGALIRAPLFPVGAENYGETVLAVDERGRVFAVDQGGDWFVGDTLDEALVTLLTGRGTPRVRADGTW